MSTALFTALVDDAAVFPPARLPLEQAVARHLEHRNAWYADLVGPLVVPAGSLPDVAVALPRGEAVDVSVVGTATSADPLAEVVQALAAADPGAVRAVAVEIPLPVGADQAQAAAALVPRLRPSVPDGVRAWVEIQREPGWQQAMTTVAAAGDDVGAKLRTGGMTPEAFPSTDQVAQFVRAAVDAGARFKLTAGLHTAVRGPDRTGAQHHGLLNVLAAVRAALDGAGTGEVAEILGETAAARLVATVDEMSPADAAAVRAVFASFGCCGVTDPIGDLVALGLLEAREPEEVPA